MSETIRSIGRAGQRQTWYPDGSRSSFAGRQMVVAHEQTGTRVALSLEGQSRMTEDESFPAMLGDWVVANLMAPGPIAEIARKAGAERTLKSSIRKGLDYKPQYCSVYDFGEESGVITKSYDYRRHLGPMQFDTMLYLRAKLSKTDEEPKISAPSQYALVMPRRNRPPSTVMERIDGEHSDVTTATTLVDILRNRIGGFGRSLLNDTGPQNWITVGTETPTHYLIDQPHGYPIVNTSRVGHAAGQLVASILR